MLSNANVVFKGVTKQRHSRQAIYDSSAVRILQEQLKNIPTEKIAGRKNLPNTASRR